MLPTRPVSRWAAVVCAAALVCVALAIDRSTKGGRSIDPTARSVAPGETRCADSLPCTAARAMAGADRLCRAPIEQLAAFGAKWTAAGLFDAQTGHARWLDRTRGTLTFVGDQAAFENGSGTQLRMTYECDFDPAANAVLDVRVRPAGLPPT